ncbi:hypothetical protein EHV15_05290 [Paenibacillus oralis]|uniref:Uncharacterized protein n=1 Tax=Paenibacillus oralis TaxID=2490856 RepID=A0A3P3TYK2_9BACL|nr:hypothetical protein [Paenibacillus oralis]RRJ62429.1 hypothetical protein EHV15_05290 [Paenibacillus oralis]
MKEIREFWSNIENVRNASPEDIQSDVLAYLNLLTEKDATIKRLETALFTHQSYDQTAGELHEENERLRKALEEILFECGQTGLEKTYYESIEGIIKICRAALGESDKE